MGVWEYGIFPTIPSLHHSILILRVFVAKFMNNPGQQHREKPIASYVQSLATQQYCLKTSSVLSILNRFIVINLPGNFMPGKEGGNVV
jgi:hypothetical protein